MIMRRIMPITVVALLSASMTQADIYTDATGEALGGNSHIDIASVTVDNDLTDITFTITVAGDLLATDWGKYLIGIDSVAGGDGAGNGWGRPISMSSGMDYFVGSWVDSGNGAEVYSWDGAAWILDHATYSPPSDIGVPVTSASTLAMTTSLSSLGLGVGDAFIFDVWSTGGGGGDSAVDALSDPNQSIADWGGPFDSTSSLSYTVVPEPATLAMVLIGLGVIGLRRTRTR